MKKTSLLKAEGFRVLRHTPKIGKRIKRKKYGAKRILGTEEGRNVLKQAIIDGMLSISDSCKVMAAIIAIPKEIIIPYVIQLCIVVISIVFKISIPSI